MEVQIGEPVSERARGGRPRLSDVEKLRRGTFQPCRAERGVDLEVDEESGPGERDFVGVSQQYAADVLAGRVVACRWIRLACERQVRDLARAAQDTAWPYIWSDAHATEACAFLEQCPHVEGKWETETITLEPSQIFLTTLLFGWRQRADPSLRRFSMLYYEMGRKGAKSTLMAGFSLFHLLREEEPGASVVCGATTGAQARIVFGIMQRMVRRSRWLRRQGVNALANSIITGDGNARPINAKSSTQDGLNPSCIVLDESHAQDFGLHDVLRSAQGGRTNPLLLAPTTAGYDLLSVGYALRTTICKVLQGVFEADHFLGLIYTLDEEDDWRDERMWVKANPMLGITPKLPWVHQYCADAQQTPGLEGEFRVKVCSQWLQSASSWLSMTQWDRCADPNLRLEPFAGQRCWIGGDLAQLDDIAAIAAVFEHGEEICAFVRFYLPRQVVDDRARTIPEYRKWVQDGLLILTEGDMIDYDWIERDIRTWCRQFAVAAIRLDQYGSATMVSRLTADGFPAAILDKNAKNFTPPARELETRLRRGRFKHDGNSCLKWMASNTVVRRGVDDTLLPKKEHPESPNKIDGIDAILQAMSAMLRPVEASPSYQMLILGVR